VTSDEWRVATEEREARDAAVTEGSNPPAAPRPPTSTRVEHIPLDTRHSTPAAGCRPQLALLNKLGSRRRSTRPAPAAALRRRPRSIRSMPRRQACGAGGRQNRRRGRPIPPPASRVPDGGWDGRSQAALHQFLSGQLKQLAPGPASARGEIRAVFWARNGPSRVRVARNMPVAQSLTPVYPTTAGLSQDALRRLIARMPSVARIDDNCRRLCAPSRPAVFS
jgi:hypothetical protein